MRVLIVSHYALPHVGGVEVLVDREVRALAEIGHDVTLLTSDGHGAAQTPHYPPSVRIVRVPAWHFLERRLRLPYPLFAPSLLTALWREVGSCDVVHAHGFIYMNSSISLVVGLMRGKPRILTDHGGLQHFSSRLVSWAARLGIGTVGRLSCRLATRLVAYNTRILRLLERLAGTTAKSLFLANPVDRALFRVPSSDERVSIRRQLGWDEGRAIVLFAGRLIPEKGVLLLLDAAAPDFDLVFCGPADDAVRAEIARCGATYLAPRPQPELVRLYQAADLLAAPSAVREGFPVVVQEALACGLPVVLGYDEGFEPYRRLEGLAFTESQSEPLRAAIRAALARNEAGRAFGGAEELCPMLSEWASRLYQGLPAPREVRPESRGDAPIR